MRLAHNTKRPQFAPELRPLIRAIGRFRARSASSGRNRMRLRRRGGTASTLPQAADGMPQVMRDDAIRAGRRCQGPRPRANSIWMRRLRTQGIATDSLGAHRHFRSCLKPTHKALGVALSEVVTG